MKTTERKNRARILRQVLSTLEKDLGRRRRRRRPDPLDTLLHAILADEGQDLQAARVLEDLRQETVDWNELRVTTPRGIEERIQSLPNVAEKAQTIRRVLHKLFREHHQLSLAHMKRYGQTRLLSELDAFGGLSQAVKARVLLKAYDINMLPLTAEIERVCKRLGLVDSNLPKVRVGGALDEILPPKRIYSFYHLIGEHAELVCKPRGPLCPECVLLKVCPRGQSKTDIQGDGT